MIYGELYRQQEEMAHIFLSSLEIEREIGDFSNPNKKAVECFRMHVMINLQ